MDLPALETVSEKVWWLRLQLPDSMSHHACQVPAIAKMRESVVGGGRGNDLHEHGGQKRAEPRAKDLHSCR